MKTPHALRGLSRNGGKTPRRPVNACSQWECLGFLPFSDIIGASVAFVCGKQRHWYVLHSCLVLPRARAWALPCSGPSARSGPPETAGPAVLRGCRQEAGAASRHGPVSSCAFPFLPEPLCGTEQRCPESSWRNWRHEKCEALKRHFFKC